jgi:hypothetical protein
VGDRIVSVNKHRLSDLSFSEAMEKLNDYETSRNLVIDTDDDSPERKVRKRDELLLYKE